MPYLKPTDFDLVHKALLGEQAAQPAALAAVVDALDLVATPTLRQQAHDIWATNDLEIDDEGVGTSPTDGGTWVQAWVWLAKEDDGL